MPPTLCHSTRASSETAETVQRTASHATQSSKSRVKRELCRAQGTASVRTPCSGQRTLQGAYSSQQGERARSIALHSLGAPRLAMS